MGNSTSIDIVFQRLLNTFNFSDNAIQPLTASVLIQYQPHKSFSEFDINPLRVSAVFPDFYINQERA